MVRQPAGKVVFDHERACGCGSAQDGRATAEGEYGAGGVVRSGLAVKRLGAGSGECFGEMPGEDTIPVGGYRHRTDACGPRRRQGAGIGR